MKVETTIVYTMKLREVPMIGKLFQPVRRKHETLSGMHDATCKELTTYCTVLQVSHELHVTYVSPSVGR